MTNEQTGILLENIYKRLDKAIKEVDKLLPTDLKRKTLKQKYIGSNIFWCASVQKPNPSDFEITESIATVLAEFYDLIQEIKLQADSLQNSSHTNP